MKDRSNYADLVQPLHEHIKQIFNSRRTGRTTAMLREAKDGDLLVFATRKEMDLAKKRLYYLDKVNVRCIVLPPEADLHKSIYTHSIQGLMLNRVLFDHHWFEEFFKTHVQHGHSLVSHWIYFVTRHSKMSDMKKGD